MLNILRKQSIQSLSVEGLECSNKKKGGMEERRDAESFGAKKVKVADWSLFTALALILLFLEITAY